MASICNDERVRFGVVSGHDRKTLKLSGHGLQHAPGAGRGIAEQLLSGAWQTLDLSAFSPQRLLTGRPFVEQAII